MNTTYFRKKDEAIRGGDLSQSQRPSYTQFVSSQNYHQRYVAGDHSQFGANGMTSGDYSQNISGCIPVLGGGQNGTSNLDGHPIKQEIDLLELCRDLNEDTFKQVQNDKKLSVNKLAQAKIQPKKKIQGSGSFNLTTSKGAPQKIESKIKEENVTMAPSRILDSQPLRPEINRKYDITPQIQRPVIQPSQGTSIAGFMGIKQQEEQLIITKQEQPVITATQQDQVMKPKKKGAAAGKSTSQMLSIAEFACNLQSADDFFQQDCPMEEVVAADSNNIVSEDDEVTNVKPANKGRQVQGSANKKRKNNEITKQEIMIDELDELLPEEHQIKRRRLNNTQQEFDKPNQQWSAQKKPTNGLSSSFMINKKQNNMNSSFASGTNKSKEANPIKIQEKGREGGPSLFSDSQIMEDRFQKEAESIAKNSLKYKCQVAYDDYVKEDKKGKEPEEFLIVRIITKVKKNGIQWTIGELADYQLRKEEHVKNKNLLEALKGSCKKVRIMMPPENFNAYSNKSSLQHLNRYSSSSSGSSSAADRISTGQTVYQMNSIVMIDTPVILFHDLKFELNSDQQNDFDLCYLTIMGKSMRKYDGMGKVKIEQMND